MPERFDAEVRWEPIPDYGELMEIQEFKKRVERRIFIDYDGTGYYATNDRMSNLRVDLADIEGGVDGFTHVMWFNR